MKTAELLGLRLLTFANIIQNINTMHRSRKPRKPRKPNKIPETGAKGEPQGSPSLNEFWS